MKRLRSVETLGSTSAINSDKTGTLTLNQMTAVADGGRRAALHDHRRGLLDRPARSTASPASERRPLDRYLLPMALCADAVAKDGELVGDPTEGALVVLAAKGGVDPVADPRAVPAPRRGAVRRGLQVHGHLPRDDRRRGQGRHPLLRQGRPGPAAGAGDARRRRDRRQGRPVDQVQDKFLEENERLGRQGLRVMATGTRDLDPATFDPNAADLLPLVSDLTLLALVGIVDPPRAEAKAAIAIAHAAGIQVRMITGDHAVTAEAIARQLGITGPGHHRRRVRRDERRERSTARSTTSASSPASRRRTRSTSSTSSSARATSWP